MRVWFVFRVFDFLCVRYTGLPSQNTQRPDNLRVDVDLSSPICWVGHCLTTKVLVDKDNHCITVHLKVYHSSMPFPHQLLDAVTTARLPATVEWIPKTLPDR